VRVSSNGLQTDSEKAAFSRSRLAQTPATPRILWIIDDQPTLNRLSTIAMRNNDH
jgi:hypothetical protein